MENIRINDDLMAIPELRNRLRKLRWFVSAFRVHAQLVEQETGLSFSIDEGRLNLVFFDWIDRLMYNRRGASVDLRDFVAFAAGLALGSLIRHAPVTIAATDRQSAQDAELAQKNREPSPQHDSEKVRLKPQQNKQTHERSAEQKSAKTKTEAQTQTQVRAQAQNQERVRLKEQAHPKAQAQDPDSPGGEIKRGAEVWPAGFLYVNFCLSVIAALEVQEFGKIISSIDSGATDDLFWGSLYENVSADSRLGVPYLDIILGKRPNFDDPVNVLYRPAMMNALVKQEDEEN